MNRKFTIQDVNTGRFLAEIRLVKGKSIIGWTRRPEAAIQFDNDEEVRATIDFIIDVINWEYDGNLTIC